MEIERKFTVKELPDLSSYPYLILEQGYLSTEPVVRVRRENDTYYLTYKGKGMLSREEYNLPLTAEGYSHLLSKADGNIITKTRYEIPEANGLIIELDIFEGRFQGLILAEVEFKNIEQAMSYNPPEWFGKDVSNDTNYHNSTMSRLP